MHCAALGWVTGHSPYFFPFYRLSLDLPDVTVLVRKIDIRVMVTDE